MKFNYSNQNRILQNQSAARDVDGVDLKRSGWISESVIALRENGMDGEVYRSFPVRHKTPVEDVLVPALQSLVSSVCIYAPSAIASVWLRWDWKAPLFVAACSMAFSWFAYLAKSRENLVYEETVSVVGGDVGRAGGVSVVGGDEVRLQVDHRGGEFYNTSLLSTLPEGVTKDKFNIFILDIIRGESLARKNWTGPGKLFGRETYDKLLSDMETAGIVKRKKNNSRVITEGGRQAIKEYCEELKRKSLISN